MKLGIAIEDQSCLYSKVAGRFGQNDYFFLLDIDNGKIIGSRIVDNKSARTGAARAAADELIRYRITHVIAGNMEREVKSKFIRAGIKIFGYSGRTKEAIEDFLNEKLQVVGEREGRNKNK